MKILNVQLKNFKRFTDLTISGLSPSIKLVLLVGSNGCGKSSVLEAFNTWYKLNCFGNGSDDKYIYKDIVSKSGNINKDIQITFNKSGQEIKDKKLMYFRTAYRNDSTFNISSFDKLGSPCNNIRIQKMISDDKTVSQNYQRLIFNTINGVFSEENNTKNVEELREELIGKIKTSMNRVFDDLILNNITNPLDNGTFYFKKGSVESFHYENLSAGEKSAFDLLLDLHLKKLYYDDSVFFIDEPETHMHTSLQGKLVEEMYNIIPDGSQLWLATHSLGVLRAAQKLLKHEPDSVAILDFSDHDFDDVVVITPTQLNKVVWEKFLSLSLDDFAELIAPENIILCEGNLNARSRNNYDASIYNKIFHDSDTNVTFICAGNSNDLKKDDHVGFNILRKLLPNTIIKKLVDMDDNSSDEINTLESSNVLVLSKRHLECYLFDDEVISLLAIKHEQSEKVPDLIQKKKAILEEANSNLERQRPLDDIKASGGALKNMLRKELSLKNCGSDVDAFMRDTLASLITKETNIYKILKADIIDKL